MRENRRTDRRDHVLQILANKFRADPERFRSYLPELLPEIEGQLPPAGTRGHVSSLTEIERERLRDLLTKVPRDKLLTEQQALQALGYCATLIQDETLPDDIDRKTIHIFLHKLIGTPISKINRKTEKLLGNGEAAKAIAVLRGVHLSLTWDDLPVAVVVLPAEFKERARALRFVGIGRGSSPELSGQDHNCVVQSATCRSQEE